MSSIVLGI